MSALRLRHIRSETLRIACECGVDIEEETARLIEAHGPDMPLPDLKWRLTGCGRREFTNYCRASYADLQNGAFRGNP